MAADAIDALLPQTQCTRCGYQGCKPYAEAIASGEAQINQCPPGGSVTIRALATLLHREPLPLNPANGVEGPALVAQIDESRCIGCAKCLPPRPVDAIVGMRRQMHTVVAELCTGCELCVAPCPVDCIVMIPRAALARAVRRADRRRQSRALRRAQRAARAGRAAPACSPNASRQRERASWPATGSSPPGRTMNPARIRAIYRRLKEANPEPVTELEYSTPFELLVAVMLSAHTTDKSVNGATRKLYPVANTPAAILALGEEGVKPYLKTVGLYNAKSKNLIELCRRILELHGGEVPNDREALESLPGVGRKTANVILNIVFGHTTIAVDTHIFRVANRTGIAPGKNPRLVEDELNEVTPEEYKHNAHHWLLLHGRYVYVARLPACPKCVIADLCEYALKTPAKELRKSDGASGARWRATPSKPKVVRGKRVAASSDTDASAQFTLSRRARSDRKTQSSMAIFAGQSREQLRRLYLEAWRKFSAKQPLEPLEAQLAAVIAEHPEYVRVDRGRRRRARRGVHAGKRPSESLPAHGISSRPARAGGDRSPEGHRRGSSPARDQDGRRSRRRARDARAARRKRCGKHSEPTACPTSRPISERLKKL